MKFGRKPVFIRVNADKACLADSERFIVEYVLGYFGEHQQLRLFIFPKTLYRNTTLVMRAFSVIFSPVKQVAVELFKANDRGDRNEGVAFDVADLVLNIAFLIA